MVIREVSRCPRSIFIFDELDRMPEGLLDTLTPFLDHYKSIGNVDYRKATFLFLSLVFLDSSLKVKITGKYTNILKIDIL